ncbi:hypothetical protein [Lacticaseibacillus absianus]|uniref:hypothetical protein n=1 Tax=Lacticaseibacillus absianus TaxID=2729623 RepID=UPI0015CD9396|nr:hypothetical protein [Lacticaseibacillus absianus]
MNATTHGRSRWRQGIGAGLIVLAVTLSGLAIATIAPTPAAKLPASGTITTITLVQDREGQATGYIAALLDGRQFAVDRGAYTQWMRLGAGTIGADKVVTHALLAPRAAYWRAALWGVMAVWSLLKGLGLLLRGRWRPAGAWRQGTGALAATVVIVAAMGGLGQPALQAQADRHAAAAPTNGWVTAKAVQRLAVDRGQATHFVVGLSYVTGQGTVAAWQQVGPTTYAHLARGQQITVTPLTGGAGAFILKAPAGSDPQLDWLLAPAHLLWLILLPVWTVFAVVDLKGGSRRRRPPHAPKPARRPGLQRPRQWANAAHHPAHQLGRLPLPVGWLTLTGALIVITGGYAVYQPQLLAPQSTHAAVARPRPGQQTVSAGEARAHILATMPAMAPAERGQQWAV